MVDHDRHGVAVPQRKAEDEIGVVAVLDHIVGRGPGVKEDQPLLVDQRQGGDGRRAEPAAEDRNQVRGRRELREVDQSPGRGRIVRAFDQRQGTPTEDSPVAVDLLDGDLDAAADRFGGGAVLVAEFGVDSQVDWCRPGGAGAGAGQDRGRRQDRRRQSDKGFECHGSCPFLVWCRPGYGSPGTIREPQTRLRRRFPGNLEMNKSTPTRDNCQGGKSGAESPEGLCIAS